MLLLTRSLTLALLLLLTTTAAAEDPYWLAPKGIIPIERRFYLFRYGTVTLEANETETVWLSLAGCPGGIDHVFAYKVNALTPGAWDYRVGWGFPHDYNVYVTATSVELRNFSEAPMTFRIKLSVRCDE